MGEDEEFEFDDLFSDMREDASVRGWSAADARVAWVLGVTFLAAALKIGVKLPHRTEDNSVPPPAEGT